jgi:hypothetical protein
MNQKIYKRLLVGGVSVMAAGALAIGYSFETKNADVFFAGAALMLAGTTCAMNAHVALLRSTLRRRW